MSSALIWQLVKDHNSFLVKRGRTSRLGAVQFSSEPGNLLNVNNSKYSGIANGATVNVSTDLTLTTKDTKNLNKPAKSSVNDKLNLHTGKSSKKVVEVVKASRPDLASTAKLRYLKTANFVRLQKGLSKKVVKSTRRHKL